MRRQPDSTKQAPKLMPVARFDVVSDDVPAVSNDNLEKWLSLKVMSLIMAAAERYGDMRMRSANMMSIILRQGLLL